jgi:hypothetical protein
MATRGSLTFDAFMERRGRDRRLARLTHDLPMPAGAGLEFRSDADPTALSDGHMVERVDCFGCGAADGPPGHTVEVVWAGADSLAAACGRSSYYDFAIASRVGQLVPDLLGWFLGIFEVLRVGGVLNIALPDRRFMSDINRPCSTLGEVLEAYYLRHRRPQFRQVFDHVFESVGLDAETAWQGVGDPVIAARLHGDDALVLAHERARAILDQSAALFTSHCWVFTPLTFLDLLASLTKLRLFPFVISQFASTDPGESDFFVCLRRDAEDKADALYEKQTQAILYLRHIADRKVYIARQLARA